MGPFRQSESNTYSDSDVAFANFLMGSVPILVTLTYHYRFVEIETAIAIVMFPIPLQSLSPCENEALM